MEIRSVFDPAFKPYGRVVEGYPVDGLLAALKTTPLPDAVAYTPREEALHAAADAQAVVLHLRDALGLGGIAGNHAAARQRPDFLCCRPIGQAHLMDLAK